MKIVNLVENTEGSSGCEFKHGLSFYIETKGHKILMDLGPSEISLNNAKKLGIDLSKVDTVILSHGHYDHSGGIMPFSEINSSAVIYLQESADKDYYADDGDFLIEEDRYRYIGIDKSIMDLSQVKIIKGDYKIDDELSLFTIKNRTHELPSTNNNLKIKVNDMFVPDSFIHEHYLVISEDDKKILISGCAHNGILSILDEYIAIYGNAPDMVISGFHLKKKTDYTDDELREIIGIAKELKKYPTKFVTCHCTGIPAYMVMKNIMGDQLDYVHSGDEVNLKLNKFVKQKIRLRKGINKINQKINKGSKNERRNTFMKWHKFFAWATVFCFFMTMITGYEKK